MWTGITEELVCLLELWNALQASVTSTRVLERFWQVANDFTVAGEDESEIMKLVRELPKETDKS